MDDSDMVASIAPDVLLATIGASPSGRLPGDEPPPDRESGLLVAALGRRGLRSEIVAWDADVDWARIPLVVVRSPWDYTVRHAEFLAWAHATAAVTTLVNDAALIAWNSHKGYLTELARAGIAVVATSLVARGTSSAGRDAARLAHGEQIVIKPAISAGAVGTIRVPAASAEAAEHLAALTRDADALVQPYLAAVERGEVSLVFFDGILSHAVRKVPAAGDFRVHVEYGGAVVAHVATPAERAVAAAVLDAAPAPATYARIDLVASADGPLLMEAELIEPELFLRADLAAADRFAGVLARGVPGLTRATSPHWRAHGARNTAARRSSDGSRSSSSPPSPAA